MKRFITIIAIIAMVTSAVFAVDGAKETHNIRLKTNVGETIPAFQLAYVSGGKDGQASTTNPAKVEYNITEAKPYAADTDVEVLDISKNDITVTFKAVLANLAKQVEDYDLTFSAGPFNVKKNGADATVPVKANSETVAAATDLADRLGVVSTGISGNTISLHFNGTNCESGDLATYTVSYTKDPAVDPNVDANTYYYADITMEVIAK